MNCARTTSTTPSSLHPNTEVPISRRIDVKGIRGRLNQITATRLDVMCVFREEGQACAQGEGDVRSGDLSKEV